MYSVEEEVQETSVCSLFPPDWDVSFFSIADNGERSRAGIAATSGFWSFHSLYDNLTRWIFLKFQKGFKHFKTLPSCSGLVGCHVLSPQVTPTAIFHFYVSRILIVRHFQQRQNLLLMRLHPLACHNNPFALALAPRLLPGKLTFGDSLWMSIIRNEHNPQLIIIPSQVTSNNCVLLPRRNWSEWVLKFPQEPSFIFWVYSSSKIFATDVGTYRSGNLRYLCQYD